MRRLQEKNINLVIYEPSLKASTFFNSPVIQNIEDFKRQSDLIIANRYHPDIEDVLAKVYTRDLYFRD